MKAIKIIPQTYTTAYGVKKSYGILINNIPFKEYNEEQLRIFLKAIGADYGDY